MQEKGLFILEAARFNDWLVLLQCFPGGMSARDNRLFFLIHTAIAGCRLNVLYVSTVLAMIHPVLLIHCEIAPVFLRRAIELANLAVLMSV